MRRLLSVAFAAALALPACDSTSSSPTADGGTVPSSSAGAGAGTATSAPSSTAPLPSDPVDACIEIMRRELSPDDDVGREARVAKGCAPIYKNPVCRDAHERYDAQTLEDRAMIVTERCRAAYCPTLPEPKPRFCAEEMPAAKDIGGMWFELRKAIWQADHGEEVAKKLEREHLRAAAQLHKLRSKAGGAR